MTQRSVPVNLAEVLSQIGDRGVEAGAGDHLATAGVQVAPLTEQDGAVVAETRRIDSCRPLSQADRCCLALGRDLSSVVVAADRAWSELETGVEL
jgi:PIN domain nuclease of toxin-antitoxin system